MAAIFDTLQYTKRAKLVGIPDEHAEFQALEIASLINDKLVTKADLKEMEIRLSIFMVKAITTAIGVLGGLQTLFHFLG